MRTSGLSQASTQHQPAKQHRALVGTRLMLSINSLNAIRHDDVAKQPRDILDRFFHLRAQAGPKPGIEGRREALFPPPADFRRDPIRQAAAQQGFALAVGNVIIERQPRGKFEESSIEKWRSTFDRTEHAGPVYLDQYLLGQISIGHVFHRRKRIAQTRVLCSRFFQFLQAGKCAFLMLWLKAGKSQSSFGLRIEKLPIVFTQKIQQTDATPSSIPAANQNVGGGMDPREPADGMPTRVLKRIPGNHQNIRLRHPPTTSPCSADAPPGKPRR